MSSERETDNIGVFCGFVRYRISQGDVRIKGEVKLISKNSGSDSYQFSAVFTPTRKQPFEAASIPAYLEPNEISFKWAVRISSLL